MTAISSSPRNTTSRVWLRIAGMSDATKNSSVAEADDDRRAVADGDDLLRIVGRDQHQREQAAHQQQRAAHGVLEAVVLHLALDQVRDDLGVGLGDERVALLLQLLLQIEVVLDDAVVDDDDLAGAVAVRDARSPRSAGRASPSACGRRRSRRSSGSVAMTSSRFESLPALRRRSSSPFWTTATPAES